MGKTMNEYFKSIGMTSDYKLSSIPCEVCDGKDFIDVLKKARIGGSGVYGDLPVKGCKRCGYIMINPRYEKQFYIDYYRRAYRKVTHGSAKPKVEYIENQKYRGKKILDYLNKFSTNIGDMLDLGCGAGATMLPFMETGWRCVGIDPDEVSVETGTKDLGLNVRLGEAESMDFADGMFDLIVCLGTMEHCYDLNVSMRAVKRALKNNGIFLMRNRAEHVWGSVIEYFSNNHYRYFTSSTLKLLMARYGFEIEDITYDPIEGIPGEFYVLARSREEVSVDRVNKKILGGLKDDILERKKYFKDRQGEFIEKSKYLLRLVEEKKHNYALLAEEIRSGKHTGVTIMVEGSAVDAVKRAVIEARGALENPIVD